VVTTKSLIVVIAAWILFAVIVVLWLAPTEKPMQPMITISHEVMGNDSLLFEMTNDSAGNAVMVASFPLRPSYYLTALTYDIRYSVSPIWRMDSSWVFVIVIPKEESERWQNETP
jgi:hypothetical protein